MAKSAKAATAQANEPQVAAEAKKPAKRAAKKPAAEAPKKTENIYVQYGGKEWDAGELAEKAKAAYAAEGHRVSAIKDLKLYIKPEEGMAYYVINGKASGSVEL